MTDHRNMDQVWIDAVVASKEAAIRDRDLAKKELAELKEKAKKEGIKL